jgi:hypothetical protein
MSSNRPVTALVTRAANGDQRACDDRNDPVPPRSYDDAWMCTNVLRTGTREELTR